MKHSLRVTSLAHRDTAHQGKYLAERNVKAARRFLTAIRKTYQRIRTAPDIGELWGDESEDTAVRCCCVRGFENYVIYYRILPATIEIMRVLHSAQDAETEVG